MSEYMKHFVEFYSPGTFVCESSRKEIPSWDTALAISMARDITERHNSKPFGFRFTTSRMTPLFDGSGNKVTEQETEERKSGIHFIGGTVHSYDEVVSRNATDEEILRSNMRCNRFWYIIVNTNSWRYTGEFGVSDCVVDRESGAVLERGDSPERIDYRMAQDRRKDAELAETIANRA